ncbi:universal stress protein [Gramella lutea]|uniref:Universal stress protein n=1 Tax=Christiangramia lutea TaxID=1607951 RepID=A0A9X2ABQ1_9FLAO|nr:universal stress protein [Christiangramia lutea]MCH4824456.1 universal stress protein [Christiangramia lutea]
MNVLILTDFLETSDNAGRYAVDFLQKKQANFFLLNIHNFNFSRSAGDKLENELVSTLDELQQDTKELKAYTRNKQHKFNTILSSESLISAVRKALVEKKIDLIFIGAVSREKHDHPILGNHAYEVVRKIKCNIIAVPAGCTYKDPKKAVFPVDPEILSTNAQSGIANDLHYLEPLDFTFLEIKDGDIEYSGLSHSDEPIKTPVPFTKKLFMELQKEFDIIFVAGKNLSICDRLLHTQYGFSVKMDINIPIFVYHG